MTAPAPISDRDPVIIGMRKSGDGADFDLLVPGTLIYFKGHFAKYPILPGIVQLDWAIRYSRHHLPVGSDPAQVVRVKFVRPIEPGTLLRLQLVHEPEARRLSFSYADDRQPYSSGRIGFGAP